MTTRSTVPLMLIALGALSACYYPRPQVAPIFPANQPLASVHVGETHTARKGEIMVDRTDGSQVVPGYLLTRQINVVGTDRQPVVDTNVWAARFQYRGPCEEGAYVVTSPSFYEERVGVIISEDGSIACDMPVVQLVGGKLGRTWQIDEPLPVGRVFDPVPFVAGFEADAVRWQVIYRGRSGKKVNLEYLEFRGYPDDNAQPSLQQTTTYDLSSTKKLSFRGTEIQVLGTTDRDITFRVARDEGMEEARARADEAARAQADEAARAGAEAVPQDNPTY